MKQQDLLTNSNRLHRLSKEQQHDPAAIVECFFQCFHLHDLRQDLWNWLQAALCTDNGIYESGRDRSNLIFLYQKIEELAEAAFIIHHQSPPDKQKHHKKKH